MWSFGVGKRNKYLNTAQVNKMLFFFITVAVVAVFKVYWIVCATTLMFSTAFPLTMVVSCFCGEKKAFACIPFASNRDKNEILKFEWCCCP